MHRRHFLNAIAALPISAISAISGACPVPIKATFCPVSVQTGIPALNDLIPGFRNQQLTVIAALPSMGKTALVSAFACNASVKNELPVAFFSCQTQKSRLTRRMLGALTDTSSVTGPLSRWRGSAEYLEPLIDAVWALCRAPLFIDYSAVLTIEQLRSDTRRLKRKYGLAMVIIDSLEELLAPGWTGKPEDLLSARLRALKSLAVEIDAPVLVTAPVSRSVESRSDPRPQLSDLKHFSKIANEHIDLMINLYRDELYNPDSSDRGVIEAIVNKHRHGVIGTARLRFNGKSLSFSSFAEF